MTIMMSRKALEEYGLVNLGNINWNLAPAVLIEHAIARNEGALAANGAFAATTGQHTGRSPKDKFIVANEEYASKSGGVRLTTPCRRRALKMCAAAWLLICKGAMSTCWMPPPEPILLIVCRSR